MDGSQLRTKRVSLGSQFLAVWLVSIFQLSLLAPKTEIRSVVIHGGSSITSDFRCNLAGPLHGVGEGVLADPWAAAPGRLRGAPGRASSTRATAAGASATPVSRARWARRRASSRTRGSSSSAGGRRRAWRGATSAVVRHGAARTGLARRLQAEEAAAAAAQRGNKASLHTAAEHDGKPAAGKTTRGEEGHLLPPLA